jgi:hypothetical protein
VRAKEGALTLIDQNAAAQLKYSTEQVYTKAEHYEKITIPRIGVVTAYLVIFLPS